VLQRAHRRGCPAVVEIAGEDDPPLNPVQPFRQPFGLAVAALIGHSRVMNKAGQGAMTGDRSIKAWPLGKQMAVEQMDFFPFDSITAWFRLKWPFAYSVPMSMFWR
jgi:hypothetical protein